MALWKKWEAIDKLKADIYVIQECSQRDISNLTETHGYQAHWMGLNKNKGLGLVVKAPYKIADFKETGFEWIGHATITGPEMFEIYPVWACISKQDRNLRYIRQVHRLIDQLEGEPCDEPRIVIGDFNSNTIWDKEHGERSHSKAVGRFERMGIQSAYHSLKKYEHGSEIDHTIYFRKNPAVAYHIDYGFVSSELLQRLDSVEIGKIEDWISLSDHMPMSIVFS